MKRRSKYVECAYTSGKASTLGKILGYYNKQTGERHQYSTARLNELRQDKVMCMYKHICIYMHTHTQIHILHVRKVKVQTE